MHDEFRIQSIFMKFRMGEQSLKITRIQVIENFS